MKDPQRQIQTLFRQAKKRPVAHNLVRMTLQVAVMWGVFLFVIPQLVIKLQTAMGVPFFEPGLWRWVAIVLFIAFGLVGFSCGLIFVIYGEGTPLPLDSTTRLVVIGPYRIVRNPMAVLGVGQGVMVGIGLGSWPVVLYSLLGIWAWNVLAKPAEERDLSERFGVTYEDYCRSVPLWIPSTRPYPRIPSLTETENSTDFSDQIEAPGHKD